MITVAPFILFKSNPYGDLVKSSLQKRGIKFADVDLEEIYYTHNLKPSKIDIIHFHWLHAQFKYETLSIAIRSSFHFFNLLIRLKVQGLRYCWTMHNIEPHENKRPVINFINYFVMARLSDAIIVLSNWQKDRIKKRFLLNSKKIFIAPHGNYIGFYDNSCSRNEAREYLGISQKKFIFLFLGQVRKYKGVIEAIKIFKKIREENDILLIVGRVNRQDINDEIMRLKDDSIISYLEFLENDKLQYYFNAADVAIFPFNKIANSGSVLLAMSFGKPIICPNMGSLIEIVKPSFGIRYPEGKLSQAMIDIKSKDLEQMSKKSYEEAKKYDWGEIAQNYIKAYEYALR